MESLQQRIHDACGYCHCLPGSITTTSVSHLDVKHCGGLHLNTTSQLQENCSLFLGLELHGRPLGAEFNVVCRFSQLGELRQIPVWPQFSVNGNVALKFDGGDRSSSVHTLDSLL